MNTCRLADHSSLRGDGMMHTGKSFLLANLLAERIFSLFPAFGNSIPNLVYPNGIEGCPYTPLPVPRVGAAFYAALCCPPFRRKKIRVDSHPAGDGWSIFVLAADMSAHQYERSSA
jgi:hypothetical protein